MDSRIVNREIRREVWPTLRKQGFDSFTPRTAWRHLPDRVWVVNFQSFNSYFSSVDGCTPFSFALNLGIYFHALADPGGTEEQIRPKEFQCHFRRKLNKTLDQQTYTRKDIWFVDTEGSNLLTVLDDARQILLGPGTAWFDSFADLNHVLDVLVNQEGSDELFGIGAKWSPNRKLLIGRCAVALGQEELGLRVLKEGEAEIRSIRLELESIGRNGRRPKDNASS